MPEISGGGYQYPKAVLDAIGKRYLVEHWESDDGLTCTTSIAMDGLNSMGLFKT